MNIIVDLQMAIASFLHFTLLTLLLSCLGNCNGLQHVESAYKDGDIMLGGLFDLHKSKSDNDGCGDLIASNLGYTEAMIFAIESINKNKSLLPNVPLASLSVMSVAFVVGWIWLVCLSAGLKKLPYTSNTNKLTC